MKVRSRRRHPDVPLGAMQLCLPMQAAPATNEAAGQEAGANTIPLFDRFAASLAVAYQDLGLQEAYTPQHCAKLERLFLHIQTKVRDNITRLEQPAHLWDQRVLSRLRGLHRSLVESLVVLRGVSGLCAAGRHLSEPSGAFWQLVDYVRGLWQQCQSIAQMKLNERPACTALSA